MFVTDHKHCTGCGSCIEACPQLAVVKIRDKYKFIYPSVQNELCDSCGRCLEVCPKDKLLSRFRRAGFERKYYAAKAKDRRVLRNSHAGGIFRVLADSVIAEGGVVYGCVFDENHRPRHLRADSAECLDKMSGLKPVQSDTDGIFTAVRADLQAGLKVLFSGTPCQCDGLLEFLGRRHRNLLVVDMLCGGVTSEGVFHRYYYWLGQRLGGKIQRLRFENKPAFGMSRGISVTFRWKRLRFLLSYPMELDMLCSMSMRGAIHRRSCGTCKYACEQRVGDISLGRFENIRRAHPNFPYNGGASLVVVSTPNGVEALERIREAIFLEQSDFERVSANHLLTSPTKSSPYRRKLLTDIFRYGFDKAAERYRPASLPQAAVIFLQSALPDRVVILLDKVARAVKLFFHKIAFPQNGKAE